MSVTQADIAKLLLKYPHIRKFQHKAPRSIEYLAGELKKGNEITKYLNIGLEKFFQK